MSVLFVSRIGRGGGWRFVSFLTASRVASRSCLLDWRFASAFRLSCRGRRSAHPSRVVVPCCPAFRVGVVLLRRFCQLVFPVSFRLFSSLSSPYSCSSRRACRMAFDRWGMAVGRGVICREAGGCGVAICGAWAVRWCRVVRRDVRGGTRDETEDETMGGMMSAPFLSARFGRSHVAIVQRGVLGEFSAFYTVR